MNDAEIRQSIHRKLLRRQHARNDTLVIDELGLNHGKCRADIAVVNGHFVGYEIKSDDDSLRRLREQVKSYNAVFDTAFIVAGERHIDRIQQYVPDWWGVITSVKGLKDGINFELVRRARTNKNVDPMSVAQLLWRSEAMEILTQRQVPSKMLRQPRAALYEHLVELLSTSELRKTVREFLRKRRNWRCLELPSQYDGLCQPGAM